MTRQNASFKSLAGMEGKKPSPADDLSLGPVSSKEGSRTSSSELLDMLLQAPTTKQQAQGELQRELTASELLKFLSRQETPGPNITTGSSIVWFYSFTCFADLQERATRMIMLLETCSTDGSSGSQSMQNKYTNQVFLSVDINSTVDYSSRPSDDTSETPHIHRSNELDELYKTGSDTRDNWWDGSLYY